MALSRFVLPFADVGSGIRPSANAELFFYATGTTTPKDTFNCPDGTTANSNPVVSDVNGLFPDIFMSGAYKVVLQDKNGVQQWEADPVTGGQNELEIIARSLNVLDSDVIYDTDTATPIPAYIYSASQQKTYSVPADAQGELIVSVIVDQLTTDNVVDSPYVLTPAQEGVLNTVSEMIQSNLTAGTTATTKSYYGSSAGDTNGAATYKILAAGEFVGVPDEFGDHTLANGNIAKIINTEIESDVLQFGFQSDVLCLDRLESMRERFRLAGGGSLVCPDGFIYRIDSRFLIDTNMSMLGKFEMKHNGGVSSPSNKHLDITPSYTTFNIGAVGIALGDTTIDVTGFTGVEGDWMTILAGDDPHDVNEERYRFFCQVKGVAGNTVSFEPPFMGDVTSPTKDTRINLFDELIDNVVIGDIHLSIVNNASDHDRCIRIYQTVNTEIGNVTSDNNKGTCVSPEETKGTKIKSIYAPEKDAPASTAVGRMFGGWGNSGCIVGDVYGKTGATSSIFCESFDEVEFNTIYAPTDRSGGIQVNVRGESNVRARRVSLGDTAGQGTRIEQNGVLRVGVLDNLGVGVSSRIWPNDTPEKIIWKDGRKYVFAGNIVREKSLPSNAVTDLQIGSDCIITNLFCGTPDLVNLVNFYYGGGISGVSNITAQLYELGTNKTMVSTPNFFGSNYPASIPQDVFLRWQTNISWVADTSVEFGYSLYVLEP